jgi:glycosyltransferase involved in cell wall biosynthesis
VFETKPAAPTLSIVVPALNEAESLPELASRIHEALAEAVSYELILVDDGSRDDTWKVMCELSAQSEFVNAIRLRKNFGKATALSAGFSKARGQVLMTMDADLQDDPKEIPAFLAALDSGLDVVVGWKVKRLDPVNRLVLTRIFNGAVRRLTGVKLHDMNCGFKAYRRAVIESVPIYGDLFRFTPALASWEGFSVGEVPVAHHARKHGSSRYGLERIFRGSFDLLTVLFLTKYSKRPMHLFGALGVAMALVGILINCYLTLLWAGGQRIGDRPLLMLGTLMILGGIQLFTMGFLGEFLTYLHQKRQKAKDLPIRDYVFASSPGLGTAVAGAVVTAEASDVRPSHGAEATSFSGSRLATHGAPQVVGL